jgi:nucleoid-associated protein YgaU
MVFKGSRYSKTPAIAPENAAGSAPEVLAAREIPALAGVLEYTVLEAERLDQLAYRFYSDAQKYWLILDANPGILNPFELLQPGRVIRIPKNQIVT